MHRYLQTPRLIHSLTLLISLTVGSPGIAVNDISCYYTDLKQYPHFGEFEHGWRTYDQLNQGDQIIHPTQGYVTVLSKPPSDKLRIEYTDQNKRTIGGQASKRYALQGSPAEQDLTEVVANAEMPPSTVLVYLTAVFLNEAQSDTRTAPAFRDKIKNHVQEETNWSVSQALRHMGSLLRDSKLTNPLSADGLSLIRRFNASFHRIGIDPIVHASHIVGRSGSTAWSIPFTAGINQMISEVLNTKFWPMIDRTRRVQARLYGANAFVHGHRERAPQPKVSVLTRLAPDKAAAIKTGYRRLERELSTEQADRIIDDGKQEIEALVKSASINLIVYVPGRGNNREHPSRYIAEAIGRAFDIPVAPSIKISESTRVGAQTHQGGFYERLLNIGGSIEASGKIDVQGRSVLVVDGVSATGLTASDAALLLQRYGAGHVESLVAMPPLRRSERFRAVDLTLQTDIIATLRAFEEEPFLSRLSPEQRVHLAEANYLTRGYIDPHLSEGAAARFHAIANSIYTDATNFQVSEMSGRFIDRLPEKEKLAAETTLYVRKNWSAPNRNSGLGRKIKNEITVTSFTSLLPKGVLQALLDAGYYSDRQARTLYSIYPSLAPQNSDSE